jgi:hypothetical protein
MSEEDKIFSAAVVNTRLSVLTGDLDVRLQEAQGQLNVVNENVTYIKQIVDTDSNVVMVFSDNDGMNMSTRMDVENEMPRLTCGKDQTNIPSSVPGAYLLQRGVVTAEKMNLSEISFNADSYTHITDILPGKVKLSVLEAGLEQAVTFTSRQEAGNFLSRDMSSVEKWVTVYVGEDPFYMPLFAE